MRKVLLIEDRVHRQKNIFGENLDKLNEFSTLKNISGGKDFFDIQQSLINKDYSVLEEYLVIMLHRSAFETNTRNGLIDYLRKTDKKVVFFSGGISGCQISTIGNIEFLLINVNQFYSENLMLFLKNEAKNLLELAFGNNWQISNLVDAYDKLTLYSKSFIKKPWANIEVDLKLNNWIREEYYSELSKKDFINKFDLEVISNKMNKDLKKLIL
jgi:hypothetical protein